MSGCVSSKPRHGWAEAALAIVVTTAAALGAPPADLFRIALLGLASVTWASASGVWVGAAAAFPAAVCLRAGARRPGFGAGASPVWAAARSRASASAFWLCALSMICASCGWEPPT